MRSPLLATAAAILASLLLVKPASADAPLPTNNKAALLVQARLVTPLAEKDVERGRFSRARPPALERRVRILDEAPRKDADGNAFYSFAIDERRGLAMESWRTAAVTGCAYVDSGEVFVKLGDRHRPAAVLLGKKLDPVAASICQSS